jgi:hypothetical protein
MDAELVSGRDQYNFCQNEPIDELEKNSESPAASEIEHRATQDATGELKELNIGRDGGVVTNIDDSIYKNDPFQNL